jgi:hypothetical protein
MQCRDRRKCGRLGPFPCARPGRSAPEFGRLPVRTIAPALAYELHVAVEPLKAGRAQWRRYLPLQGGLGVIVGAAHGFGYRERNLLVVLVAG